MTKFEDNLSPYLTTVEQGSTPSNPASGNQKLFVRTSDHTLCYVNSSGTVTQVGAGGLSNPMTTKGDIIIADTGGTPTRLAAGATAGMVLRSAGSGAFETWALPTGYEFDYVAITSTVNITATTEATANTVVTGNAVTYNGTDIVMVEFFTPYQQQPTSQSNMFLVLYDGSSSIGEMSLVTFSTGSTFRVPVFAARRITPSNASHTYSVRGYVSGGTGVVGAGAGGNAADAPAFIRITKV